MAGSARDVAASEARVRAIKAFRTIEKRSREGRRGASSVAARPEAQNSSSLRVGLINLTSEEFAEYEGY